MRLKSTDVQLLILTYSSGIALAFFLSSFLSISDTLLIILILTPSIVAGTVGYILGRKG